MAVWSRKGENKIATDDSVIQLLDQDELPDLDFKASTYIGVRGGANIAPRGTGGNGVLDLVKDVLCLANTPRKGSSHLILGVQNKPSGNRVVGLKEQDLLDDNDIQAVLRRWCQPVPMTILTNHSIASRDIQVLEIQIVEGLGPFFLKSAFSTNETAIIHNHRDFLKSGQLYFRRGTSNSEATLAEEGYIKRWFAGRTNSNWQTWTFLKSRLADAISNTRMALITGSLAANQIPNIETLGNIDWTAVFDFDPGSAESGLLMRLKAIGFRRSLSIVVRGENSLISPGGGLHWFFSRGFNGRPETLVPVGDRPWSRWRNLYATELQVQMKEVSKATLPDQLTVVILWYESSTLDYLKTMFEISAVFENPKYLVISDISNISDVLKNEEFDIEFFPIALQDLCNGLGVEFSGLPIGSADERTLPSNSGSPAPIPKEKEHWLEVELELMYRELDSEPVNDNPIQSDFLKGGMISYDDLKMGRDVEREKYQKTRHKITQDLENRETVRISLYHQPGSGGSTFAYRIAWDLHQIYPVGVLKRVETATVSETLNRLAYIYSLTNRSLLLVVDGSTISNRTVEDLYGLLRSSNLPVVLLLVNRRLSSQDEAARVFQLGMNLTLLESSRFLTKYSEICPEKVAQFRAIHESHIASERSAFIYGLTAFEKGFLGIESFVKSRLVSLSSTQKQIMLLVSISYEYGQRGLPAQAFSRMLGLIGNRQVNFESLFRSCSVSLDLLVLEDGVWRPIHVLVATKIIQELLTLPGGELDTWKQQLSDVAISLLGLCRADGSSYSSSLVELVRRVCVYRDSQDPLGREGSTDSTTFSRLIQDIPSNDGRVRVLRALTDYFPEEPHFWGHLGRFLSHIMNDHKGALEAIEHGISLNEKDHVLLHMKGMVLRVETQELIEAREEISTVIESAKLASDAFAQARAMQPDDEHTYISEVQLRIRVLGYVKRLHNSVLSYVGLPGSDPYVRSSFVVCEDLLSQVKGFRGTGQSPSRLEEQCRADLAGLYGDYSRSLEIWENLLVRPELAHIGIRRQIVYTNLARYGSWSEMPKPSVDRATGLLTANLDEDSRSEADLRLWLQAIRYSTRSQSLETIVEKVSYWRTNTDSLEANYYTFVLLLLRMIQGTVADSQVARESLERCRSLSRFRKNRTNSFEWYGEGEGIQGLVHQSRLGDWNHETNFWLSGKLLRTVEGVVSRVDGPEAGTIDLHGFDVFFVPIVRSGRRAITRNDLNHKVRFNLGFSYSGLRAWNVE